VSRRAVIGALGVAGRRVAARAVVAVLPRRFDADAARGIDAVIELQVLGAGAPSDTVGYDLSIRDGRCRVRRAAGTGAGASFTVGLGDLVRLGLGVARWYDLLGAGRLEMRGDPFIALRFPAMFHLAEVRPRRAQGLGEGRLA
jgi:hypothetical protein